MSVKNQHFIPQVYLKQWNVNGAGQVYCYKKENLSEAVPKNISKILCQSHTYTIGYDDCFFIGFLTEAKKDFSKQLESILKEYSAVAYFDGKEIKDFYAAIDYLYRVDEWDFRKASDFHLLAPKKAIVARIKEIRSYILESRLDNYVEKKWSQSLNLFLQQLNDRKDSYENEQIDIDSAVVDEIVSTMLIFMCRNPAFDCLGVFPWIKDLLLSAFNEQHDKSEETISIVNKQLRGAWLSQLYKALYSSDTGFFVSFYSALKHRAQATIIYCPTDTGSFITSDNPAFSYIDATKPTYNAIYFPLTPQYLLLIGNGEKYSLNKVDYKIVSKKGVRSFNSIICNMAYEKIISNRSELDDLL